MPEHKSSGPEIEISRERLAELLNEDLSREYQAIIAYVVYSQVLKGAAYMDIANELEIHARQELDHALIISKQIDYLGGMPTVTPEAGRTSDDGEEMLRFDLDNETKRSATIASAFGNARRWVSSPWRNRSARSWCRNRTTRSTWPPLWAKTFRM